jgi:hypothetical protein
MPRVRMLVNRVSEDSDAEVQSRAEDLIKRVLEVEEREQNSMRE